MIDNDTLLCVTVTFEFVFSLPVFDVSFNLFDFSSLLFDLSLDSLLLTLVLSVFFAVFDFFVDLDALDDVFDFLAVFDVFVDAFRLVVDFNGVSL